MKYLIIVIACVSLLACASETEEQKAARIKELFRQDQHKLIDAYFAAQTKGASVKEFGCNGVEIGSLLALKSWSIVDETKIDSTEGSYTIRAESSNGLGLSVNKLWSLKLSKENGKYCVASFVEKQ